MQNAYKVINDTLVSLINKVWELEGKAIITEEFRDITNNDMHVIEAIGIGDGDKMSAIAKKLNITVGSLTAAINSLVKKKYVERNRSEEDRRIVYIKLTEKGEKAYYHHEEYHHEMTEAVLNKLDQDEVMSLVKALEALEDFFHGYGKNHDSQEN